MPYTPGTAHATNKTDATTAAGDHAAHHNALATDVNALEAHLAAAPQSGVALVVAATDSPAAWKAKADYQCDGTADQNEFAAAVTALPATGGVLQLAPGAFSFNGPLTLTKPVTLRGSGRRASRIALANGMNDYGIKIDAQAGSEGRDFWLLEDFGMDCNAANQVGGGGILAAGACQSTFQNLHITRPHSIGLYLNNSTAIGFGHHNRIAYCLFDGGDQSPGTGQGLRVGPSDENVIFACDFENNGGAAGAEENTAQLKLEAGLNTVQNCVFVNGKAGLASHDCNDNRILGCIFDGSALDQLRISGARNSIIGNSFTSPGSNAANNVASAIRVTFGDDGNQIIGNFLASHTTATRTRSLIRFEGSGGQTNNVVVGNRFQTLGSLGTALIEDGATRTRYDNNVGFDPATQTVAAATAIKAYPVTPLTASGATTMTAAPTIADGYDGQEIVLLNVGATNNIVLQDQGTLASSNLRLTATTVTLGPRDSIRLAYSAAVGDWMQTGPLVAVL
jgi:hypothetical protein